MTINFDAIRRRMEELNNGGRRNSNAQLWKPGPGEYRVRLLPWKSGTTDGIPFIERWFYYIGNAKGGILAPKQFGKPDPIDELVHKLFMTKDPDDRIMAKKLMAKNRAFIPVIVRGQEDKGIMVWSLGKGVYTRLMGFILDEDYQDIINPETGWDLKVKITQIPGKDFPDTVVDCKKQSKLSDDPEQAKKWLDSVPSIDDVYRQKTPEEIESILNSWLNGPTETPAPASAGTTRGDAKNELDELTSAIKNDAEAQSQETPQKSEEKPKPETKKATKKADAQPPQTKKSLDDAFDDLINDDE